MMVSYNYCQCSATTCVCMAYKKFEMQQFILNMLELLVPTKGTMASSQKDELDKMMRWDENSLVAYQLKKEKNKNY